MSGDVISEIVWEQYSPGSFNAEFPGYTAAHYHTGTPVLGWCLYSKGASCWEQRTKQILPPEPGAEVRRVNGKWCWVRPAPVDDKPRPEVCAVEIERREGGFQLSIYGNAVRRYRSTKPTIDEAVEELNHWMKGVIVW